MADKYLVNQILKGNPEAKEQFLNRYSDMLIRVLVFKCRMNCHKDCPLRYRINQNALEQARCDELMDMYVFSVEYLIKRLKHFDPNNWTLDKWMESQLYLKGNNFRYMFIAYLVSLLPITAKIRIPSRFGNVWTTTEKIFYKEVIVRNRSIPEILPRLNSQLGKDKALSEEEATMLIDQIVQQLADAGLLGPLLEQVELERFQNLWRTNVSEAIISESVDFESGGEISLDSDFETEEEPTIFLASQPADAPDKLVLKATLRAIGVAFSRLSPPEKRVLKLRFDDEWSLSKIAQHSKTLGLDPLSTSKVSHLIDNALKKMISIMQKELANIGEVQLQVPGLKNILDEWGTKEWNDFPPVDEDAAG
jgi:DNA-directed RNA polymerase specialized sigma24 family protein